MRKHRLLILSEGLIARKGHLRAVSACRAHANNPRPRDFARKSARFLDFGAMGSTDEAQRCEGAARGGRLLRRFIVFHRLTRTNGGQLSQWAHESARSLASGPASACSMRLRRSDFGCREAG